MTRDPLSAFRPTLLQTGHWELARKRVRPIRLQAPDSRLIHRKSGSVPTSLPPSSLLDLPSSIFTPPSSILHLPSSILRLPSSSRIPPSSLLPPPSSIFTPPSSVLPLTTPSPSPPPRPIPLQAPDSRLVRRKSGSVPTSSSVIRLPLRSAVLPFGICLLTFDLTPYLLRLSSNPNGKLARRPSAPDIPTDARPSPAAR